MDQPVVIITGASSGIGAAAALTLGDAGYRVVIAARRMDRLTDLASRIHERGGDALPVQIDLSQTDQVENLVKTTLQVYDRIDVLINNAGYSRLVWLDEQSAAGIQDQIQVNLISPILLTRAVLPLMLSQGSGQIIQIASISSWVGLPTYSIYTAFKFGLRGFMESLRRELRGSGITVSVIYPGAVDTEFDQHAGVHWKTTRVTPNWLLLPAEKVSQYILDVIQKKKKKIIVPGVMRLAIWANTLFPRVVSWVLSKYFYREDGKTVAWRDAQE